MKLCETCSWLGFKDDFEKHMPRTEKYPGYVQPVCCYPGEVPLHIVFIVDILWNQKAGCWNNVLDEDPHICWKYKKSDRTKLEKPEEPVFKCCKCGKVLLDGDVRYNLPTGLKCLDCHRS